MSFAPGQRVRTRLMSRSSHSRLPLYARGRTGVVSANRGSFPLADDVVRHGRGEPQALYNVRFAARDLWGPEADTHDVHLDLFESYLEASETTGVT